MTERKTMDRSAQLPAVGARREGALGSSSATAAERRSSLPDRPSDVKFRRVFDYAPFGMVVIGEGVMLECNDAFSALLGYRADELRGKPWSTLWHSEEWAAQLARVERLRHGSEAPLHGPARYVARDGVSTTLVQTLSSLGADATDGIKWLVTLQPGAASPTHGGRFLRRVLDNLYAFVGVMAPDGTLLEANRAPLAAAGVEPDEVVGRKFWDCYWWSYSPDVKQRVRAAAQEAARGVTVRFDEWIRVAGDGRMLIDFQLAPLFDERGQITHLIPSGMDLTARHAVETALRESEGRFRAITDALPLLVWLHDADGRQEFVNATFCEFFGVSGEEMRGERWKVLTDPDEGDEYARHFMICVRDRRVFHGQVRVRNAKGEWRWLESWARPRFGPEGEYLGHIGTSVDITERRRAEAELREADRRKDHFLATLAHELRNPLAPLRTGLTVLDRVADQSQVAADTRRTMTRQVDHLVRLFDDLLDVSRISQGKIELRRARVEIASVVHGALETCRAQLEARRVELALPAEPLHVNGDPVRLAQVIGNLLHNACKFTDPGGNVRVVAEATDGMVQITISDDGVGIPPDKLDAAFEMFAQVGLAIDRERMGLGIGLALSRQLVQMHGGTLHAFSEGPGSGAELVIRLPRERSAAAPPSSEVIAELNLCRVLIVDDNRDAAELLETLLRLEGVETAIAYSGGEAIEQFASFGPSVVLLDLGMPGMDGYATCRAIRSGPLGSSVKIVAVTGWGQESDRQRSAAAGFDAHLVKPVDAATLINTINSPVHPPRFPEPLCGPGQRRGL